MKLENVKKFIELAKSEGVSELKYEEKDLKIAVSFSTGIIAQPIAHHPTQSSAHSTTPSQSSAENISESENFHVITSPFVGTFYASSAPGEPSFVNVGDKVFPGKTLCILEAMKIMNEIESDTSGEIVEICVENESLVEYGQALFKVRK